MLWNVTQVRHLGEKLKQQYYKSLNWSNPYETNATNTIYQRLRKNFCKYEDQNLLRINTQTPNRQV